MSKAFDEEDSAPEDAGGDEGDGIALTLKGDEELQMDYDVFGSYVQCGTENGKPKFLGPKTEGSRPSIAFCIAGDGKPTWWVYDASGGECFYAESDSNQPPRSGWRKEYSDEDLEVTCKVDKKGSAPKKSKGKKRSRSPRGRCPW
mmetsp:Transcript_84213/g.146232  ORF Transcript_84213/g.146232 Transcript_84213/m.146232 type:complete len:145 (-) Transcript_84213:13-447(-)